MSHPFTTTRPTSNAKRLLAWRRKNGPLRAQIEREVAQLNNLDRRRVAAGSVV